MATLHTHDSSHPGNNGPDPFWIPIVVPLAAAVFVALIFIACGDILTRT